jgi:hypothetical protein
VPGNRQARFCSRDGGSASLVYCNWTRKKPRAAQLGVRPVIGATLWRGRISAGDQQLRSRVERRQALGPCPTRQLEAYHPAINGGTATKPAQFPGRCAQPLG